MGSVEMTEGSVSSQSYLSSDSSIRDLNSDSEIDQVLHSRRVSSVVATDCVVDIENGVDEVRISVGTIERECRICMLSLDEESGIAIELGCCCKNELAAAHQHCAQQWFKSRGNKICEICKSMAQNVVIPNDIKSRQQISLDNRILTSAVPVPTSARNAFSTNAVSVSVFEQNIFSTNLISFSTNEVSAPVSSIPENGVCLVLIHIVFTGVLVALLLIIITSLYSV